MHAGSVSAPAKPADHIIGLIDQAQAEGKG